MCNGLIRRAEEALEEGIKEIANENIPFMPLGADAPVWAADDTDPDMPPLVADEWEEFYGLLWMEKF